MKNTEQKIPALRFPEFSGEWEEKRLGEVLSIGNGRDYKHLKEGDIPVYGTGGYMTSVDRFLYEGETVCIGRKGTIDSPMFHSGKIWTVDTLFYTYDFVEALPKFIYNIFQNINWKKYNEASGVPSLSKSTIEKLNILLPSLPEQQKIADFLSAVDKRLQLLKDKKTKLEEYKRGVMQRIFSQELRFTRPDGSAYPDWEEKRLGEMGAIFKGAQLNSENLLIDGEYPVLNGGVSFSGFYDRYNKEAETVTISEGGNSCGYVNLVRTKFWSGGHCYTLESLNVNIDKYYLYQYLKHKQPEIMRLRVGSGLPNIQKKDIEVFKVNLPCLDEQRQIADFLSAIDDKISLLSKQIQSTEQYKKGLLQQMFV